MVTSPLPPTGILGLPVAIALDGTEYVPLVQGGTTKRSPVSEISSFPANTASFVLAVADPLLPQSRVLSAQIGVTTITDGGSLGPITVGIATNGIGNTQLRQSAALSVIGNATVATANVADISAASDFQILRRSGSAIGFGSINLASSAAVGTSILPAVNGGTGVNNGSSTITLGGSLTTLGAFSSTFTMTGPTSVTFPTSGTLATTSGPSLPAVAQGDLLYGSGPNVLSTLAKSATATRYLANTGTSNNPNWDQINLANGVTGTLAVGNGGTGLSSGTSGGILGFTASGTLASSVALTANALVLGGGAGATPSPMASLGTTTTVLHGNASGAPTFGQVVGSDIATNTVANSNLAQAGAATIKGNPTASTANVQDFTIQGLTTLSAPDPTADYVPIYDHASGTIKKTPPNAVAGINVDQNITSAGPVAVQANATTVRVNQTVNAPITLTMPSSSTKVGGVLICDWKGNAGTYNITITLAGGDTFPGGLTTWVIASDAGSIYLNPIPGVGYAL